MSFQIGLPFIGLFFILSLFEGIKYPLMLISAILIHELGHILAAKLCHAPMLALRCGLAGFSLSFDFSVISHARECMILLSGSVCGLVAAFIALLFGGQLLYFACVSLILSVINLLPIRTLDGGEALLCLLDWVCLPDRAYRIAHMVSWVSALLFWFAMIWIQFRIHPNLSLLAASLYFLWCNIRG